MKRATSTHESLVRLSLAKEEDPIIVRVQRQHEADISYWIGRNVELEYVMRDYCDRKGVVYEEMRFIFYGTRVRETDTPEGLEMEDDFVIDAMSDQIGG